MVAKGRGGFPAPPHPGNTIHVSRGRSNDPSWRLCSRAPRTTKRSAIWVRIPVKGCWQGRSDLGFGGDVGRGPRKDGAALHRVWGQHRSELGDLVSEQRRLLELQALGRSEHLRLQAADEPGELVGVGTER